MGKAKAERRLEDNEAQAHARFVQSSSHTFWTQSHGSGRFDSILSLVVGFLLCAPSPNSSWLLKLAWCELKRTYDSLHPWSLSS